MKISTLILISIFVLSFNKSYSQDCVKCDIEPLIILSENIDNLNLDIVKNFVCTFDSTCINNVEYSEWSNELLYSLIFRNIDLLNEAMHSLGYKYVLLIAKELEDPIIDVDYIKAYNIIKNTSGPKDIISEEKRAIINAAEKAGVIIE